MEIDLVGVDERSSNDAPYCFISIVLYSQVQQPIDSSFLQQKLIIELSL